MGEIVNSGVEGRMTRTKEYSSLNGMKAFAAIGIMLMHIRANGNYYIDGYLYNTVILSLTDFVFLFMVISAFGLCCGYFEKMVSKNVDILGFYSRRFQKIFPFFALMVLIDILTSPSKDAVKEAFADLTLMFGFLPNPGSISVIGVGWFIGLIFVFYLCFPFFCFLLVSKQRAWTAFAVSILWNIIGSSYFSLGRSNILYSGCFFLAGGLIYLYRKEIERVPEIIWIVLTAGAIGLYYVLDRNSIAALLLAALLLAVGITDNSRLLNNRVVTFLSSISLEIYICHMAVFRVMKKLHLARLLGDGWESYAITAILVLTGASIFALVAQRGFKRMESVWKRKAQAERN